jgi:ABC-type Zn uptake system ZnuABC Zn-binding protein ZnuA
MVRLIAEDGLSPDLEARVLECRELAEQWTGEKRNAELYLLSTRFPHKIYDALAQKYGLKTLKELFSEK